MDRAKYVFRCRASEVFIHYSFQRILYFIMRGAVLPSACPLTLKCMFVCFNKTFLSKPLDNRNTYYTYCKVLKSMCD